MTDSRPDQVVSEEKHIDNTRDDREPGAPGLAGDEALPEVEDEANPENLAGNKDQEQGEEEQEIEEPHLTPTRGEQEGTKGNQRKSDRTLVNSKETDHPCHLRAGKLCRDYTA